MTHILVEKHAAAAGARSLDRRAELYRCMLQCRQATEERGAEAGQDGGCTNERRKALISSKLREKLEQLDRRVQRRAWRAIGE